jgi:hypothetical protein
MPKAPENREHRLAMARLCRAAIDFEEATRTAATPTVLWDAHNELCRAAEAFALVRTDRNAKRDARRLKLVPPPEGA